jgi:hypothetical protein
LRESGQRLHAEQQIVTMVNSYSQPTMRRDGRVAEGARLESVFRGNSNLGSNPSLSATIASSSRALRAPGSRAAVRSFDFAQDFACGLPLRSRPQNGSSSNPSLSATIASSRRALHAPGSRAAACGPVLRLRSGMRFVIVEVGLMMSPGAMAVICGCLFWKTTQTLRSIQGD